MSEKNKDFIGKKQTFEMTGKNKTSYPTIVIRNSDKDKKGRDSK